MSSSTFVGDLRAEVEVPRNGILSRTIHADDHVKAVLFAFDAGQELSEHAAGMPAVIQILEGLAEVTLGDDVHEAAPGAWMTLPTGLRHAVRAKTPLILLLLLLRDPVA